MAQRKGAALLVAAAGQEIPGTDARLTGHADGISLNDSGAVAFAAAYYGSGCLPPGNTCLMVLLQNDAGIRIIARQGRTAPGSGGGEFTMDIGSTALNDSGQLVFHGDYQGGICTLSGSCGGVYLASGGPAEALVVWGQPVPGLKSARFYDAKAPSINRAGEIAVLATYKIGRAHV